MIKLPSILFWCLLSVSTFPFLSFAQDEPSPQPKPKPAVAPTKGGTNSKALPSSAAAKLLVMCDLACTWKLDGEAKGVIAADGSARVSIDLGQHAISAATEDGSDQWEKDIEIKQTGQTIVHINLAPVRATRLQQASQEGAREKAARVEAEGAAIKAETAALKAMSACSKEVASVVPPAAAGTYIYTGDKDSVTGKMLTIVFDLKCVLDAKGQFEYWSYYGVEKPTEFWPRRAYGGALAMAYAFYGKRDDAERITKRINVLIGAQLEATRLLHCGNHASYCGAMSSNSTMVAALQAEESFLEGAETKEFKPQIDGLKSYIKLYGGGINP